MAKVVKSEGSKKVSKSSRWKKVLRADPVPWLIQHGCAPVRYRTFVELEARSKRDIEVRKAKEEIYIYPPVLETLRRQSSDGSWGRNDYQDKHGGTLWQLRNLAEWGLRVEDEPIRKAVDHLLQFQVANGAFTSNPQKRANPSGDCTSRMYLLTMAQVGVPYEGKLKRGFQRMFSVQRNSGGWGAEPCVDHGRTLLPNGCNMMTRDVVEAFIHCGSEECLDFAKRAVPFILKGLRARYGKAKRISLFAQGYGVTQDLLNFCTLADQVAVWPVNALIEVIIQTQREDGYWEYPRGIGNAWDSWRFERDWLTFFFSKVLRLYFR